MARTTRRLCLSLLSAALSMALILCIFPTAAPAANHEISAGGTYSLNDYTFSAGDTLTIREGLTVTISGGATNISILCEPNVNLTINGVGITVATGYDLSPIAFTGGTANTLTIAGDSSLTAQNNQAALRVEGSTALTISGSATLYATSFQGAAIGSGISADSGAITITGGNIDAQCGSNGAGIGGGGDRSNGTVNITGGTVYASSALRGAGIGGGGTDLGTGGSGGSINISGGRVTAVAHSANHGGAGIGGGASDSGTGGSGGTINITGGAVNATGRSGGAGIGGGGGGAGGSVTITNKANVDATGSGSGYDVGSGAGNAAGGTLSIDGYAILRLRANGTNAAATVNTGTVTGSSGGPLSGAYYSGTKLPGEVIDWGDPYLADGTGYTFDGSTVVIGSSGDYAVVGKKSLNYSTITVSAGLTANIAMLNTYMYRDNGFSPLDLQGATVTMTLYGDTEMICNDRPAIWLNSNSDLTIQGSGTLTATSNISAGIGSTVDVDNGNITIKGGTIIATGGIYSAGIGGDGGGDGGAIRIEGGNVTAAGGTYQTVGGAGIGGGTYAGGGNITITGGTVTATGGAGSAGIGGGGTTNTIVGNGGTINISGGIVNATGGGNGAGIGGGQGGSGGIVNISGSAEVKATGGASAAGIGGGNTGTAGTISLSGGSVYAAGANGGQDIGYGDSGSGGTVSISGSAAVFLARDSVLTPTTTTHTHLTYTEDTDDIFGYAIPGAWTPAFGAYLRVYTLLYNANGGAGTAPSSLTKLYQNTSSVSGGSGLTRENYTFSGWNTAVDGSGTDYNEGDTFAFTANTTLFAQWVPVSYMINYDLDGGTVSPANPSSYTVESGDITLRNPERTGFSFAGWSGTGITGTSMSVTIPAGSTGNRSFTANWTETPPAFVPVTGITGVPAAATAGTPLTLTGAVAPANATNQTIVWSVQSAGTTNATLSGNTLSTTAAGTVTVRATITNGLTESSDYTRDFTIAVNSTPVIDATISPVTGSFDKNNPADVATTVTWNSATAVAVVRKGATSLVSPADYIVTGDTLTIKKEYLLTQSTGSLALTIGFDQGAEATLTININDGTPPSISPTSFNYDLSAPGDVTTTITWNSALTVTDVVYGSDYLTTPGDFTVSGNILTINDSYLSGLTLSENDTFVFVITFNTGATGSLTVNVVDNYTPSNDATLSDLKVGGTTVSGFDPSDEEYDVELPYGTLPGSAAATVGATANESYAQVNITQASAIPGSATVAVTAEDNTSTRTYTINFTIGAAPAVSVTSITNVPATGTAGTEIDLTGATVNPADATNKTIVWTVKNAGTTGVTTAAPATGRFTPANAGTLVLTATITNGIEVGTDYTQDFTIFIARSSRGGGGGGGNSTQPVSSSTGLATVAPSAGGSVSLGSDVTLNIPPNALQGSVSVQVAVQKVDTPPPAPSGFMVVGTAYRFTIDGQEHYSFDKPVTLTFTFDPSKLAPGETPAVHYYDEEEGRWVNLGGTVSGNTITVTADHFTKFAVLAVKSAVQPVQPPEQKPALTLTDLSGHWAEKNIEKLVEMGAVSGYPDGTFKPDGSITRAEFTAMLVKAFKLQGKDEKVFADTTGHWARGVIATAASCGIVGGYDQNNFGPDDPVTREQMAVMTVKAAKLSPASGELAFTDNKKIAAWAYDSIATAVKCGIIKGYRDNTFRPAGNATRAEAVTMIVNALK